MKKNKETTNQKKKQEQNPKMMYSEMMKDLRLIFGLESPPEQEKPTENTPSQQDNTIEITFLKHPKKGMTDNEL